jgi:hypothetical protein
MESPQGGGAASLSAEALRYALLIVDEALEAVGAETAQFPGRERLNKGLAHKGLHRPGEPDPWCARALPRGARQPKTLARAPPAAGPPGASCGR